MSLSQAVRNAFRAGEREPGPAAPVHVPRADCQELGTIRGRQWLKNDGHEYMLDRRPLRDDSPITRLTDGKLYIDDTMLDADGNGWLVYWGTSRPYPSGTAAAGGRLPRTAKVRTARPFRRVDALTAIALFDARPERWSALSTRAERDIEPLTLEARERLSDPAFGSSSIALRMVDNGTPIVKVTPAEQSARARDAVVARLLSVHVKTMYGPDGTFDDYASEGGTIPPELLPMLQLVKPIVANVGCAIGSCDGDTWTVTASGKPICERHAAEELRP